MGTSLVEFEILGIFNTVPDLLKKELKVRSGWSGHNHSPVPGFRETWLLELPVLVPGLKMIGIKW